MQGDRKFSHITVTSGEDDDVVIQAGVRAGSRPPADAPDAQEPAAEDAGPAEAPAGDAEPAKARFAVPDGGAQGARASGAASSRGTQGARAARRPQEAAGQEDAYRETTLEDLEGSPMSNMQKAIVALALLLIVAAVVYYFAVMR